MSHVFGFAEADPLVPRVDVSKSFILSQMLLDPLGLGCSRATALTRMLCLP